jgi:hypothetical protein
MDAIKYMISNPGEYWPVFVFGGVFLAVWLLLVAGALIIWRRSRIASASHSRLLFVFAVLLLSVSLCGLLLGTFHFDFNFPSYRGRIELKWLFILPTILCGLAGWNWFRLNRRTPKPA